MRIADIFEVENEMRVDEIGTGKLVEIYSADVVARNRKLLEQRRAWQLAAMEDRRKGSQ